jgi:hypothetical protein
MNKTIALTFAAVMAATTAAADTVARNNVACSTGSVYGFTVFGDGLTNYVQAKDLDRCPAGTVGVPASVDIFEPAEVVEWLADNGVDITGVQLRDKTEVFRQSRDASGAPVVDGNGDPVLVSGTRRAANGGW